MASPAWAAGSSLPGDLALHDPSTVLECDGAYWVFGTGRGVVCRSSQDLVAWRLRPPVFASPPAWTTNAVPQSRGRFWAPDLIRLNGRFLLYYSVSSWGSRQSAIGLASSPTLNPESPACRWEDRGCVIRSSDADDFNAIDPSILQQPDGRLWLAFGSFWSGIKLVELHPQTGLRLEPKTPPRALAWQDAIEAPCLHRHGDHYYLFVNWGLCCRGTNSTYNIRVGRSPTVTGPYLDRDGIDLLHGGGSLVLESARSRIGPGHAGLLRRDGADWLSYHFYDGEQSGVAKLGLAPLHWSPDGWPLVAPALPAPPTP